MLGCRERSWLWIVGMTPLLLLGPTGLERPSAAQADKPAPGGDAIVAKAAAALYDGIRVETLANGLRVYLKPVPGAATVTTMVAYKVGSCDEELDQTGLSHYLEHLLFKGTEKLFPRDIDRLTLVNGGANNAYTSDDMTVYHFDFAAEQWEVPLKIEADRMRNVRIDAKHEFEKEKEVVVAELETGEDRPWELEGKAILPLLFGKTAPYGHPVIGEREHVRGATAEIIKRYYDQWYHPNNAALIVTGGFDPDKVMARIKELFGPIQAARLPERKTYTPLVRKGPVKLEMPSKFEVARMVMGWNTIRSADPDFHALEVLQVLLSGGKTSRLYKKLVEGAEIASVAEASNSTGRYPGWFGFYVELLQGQDRAAAEKLLLAELKRLADEPISAAELKRAQQSIIAGAIYGRESVHALADSISQGVTTNDLDFVKNYLPKIAAVTPADVQRVAKLYFNPEQRVTVWSVPLTEKKGAGRGGARTPRAARALAKPAAAGQQPFSLKNTQRVVLPNGLTLLLLENRRLPIFVAQAYVKNVRLLEPDDKAGLATLTGRLMDEGTAKRTGAQIAELIEDVGGSLGMGLGGSSLKVLAPDRKLGLSLFFECLMAPAFPKEAFQRQQTIQLTEIADAETQPDDRASRMYSSLIYGAHPFGRPSLGRAETVKKLTPEDCKAFHRLLAVPNNTVVAIVGDFDTKQVIAEITQITADWKKASVPTPNPAAVKTPDQFVEKVVTMPDAERLYFYMGSPGIRRSNPDYYKLLVMDYILGTGPGFTDRLSGRLRDREGLAYTVRANITSSAGEEPGDFTCYIACEPKNFLRVKEMFLEELNRIIKEQPTAEEVDDAKKYLLGNLAFRFTSNDRIAGQLLGIERYQLGFGHLDDFRKAVSAVTAADVHAVAKKYIDPQKMVLVVAGAIDQTGRPILKIKPAK